MAAIHFDTSYVRIAFCSYKLFLCGACF